MSVRYRAPRTIPTIVSPAGPVPPATGDVTYKGYRIEPASYGVNSTTWSPRAVISVRVDNSWSRLMPLYSTNTARYPTRDEADRCALDVARAWIDAEVGRPGEPPCK